MAHKLWENYFLSSEIEDQYLTHLDLQTFFTIDNNLVETAGMKRIINVYSASDNTVNVDMGEGNADSIEVDLKTKEYVVLTAQNRFVYYDEQEMTDPNVVPVGMQRMGTGLFNKVNSDVLAELDKATLYVATEKLDFNAFVDAVAKINVETTDNDPQDITVFGLVSPSDMADIRKELKDDLKFVEAYSRTGYVGTVAGVSLFVSKAVKEGTVIIATKKAVTVFNKKGVEVEQDRDVNTRENEVVSRKYYIAALTDATKAVKIIKTDDPSTPSVTLDKSEASVVAGETVSLSATTIPAGETVTWTSSDDTAATVANGVVTGVAAGSATITAKITVDGVNYTDTCAVTVTAAEANG